MDAQLRKSLAAVLEYLRDEKENFEASAEGRGAHIYEHVAALGKYLRRRKGKRFTCPRCKSPNFLLLLALSDVRFTKDGASFIATAPDYETNRDGLKCDACDYGSEEEDDLSALEGVWKIEARRVE